MRDFSVIMSVYLGDEPLGFEIAIESILNQTLLPNEILVGLDGPISKEM